MTQAGLIIRAVVALALTLGLIRPQVAAADEPTDLEIVTKVRLTADRIEYSGIITHEANAGVFELYETARPKPQELWIESQGGSAGAGMELGAWILAEGLDVSVDTYCFSSCANYVFTAGQTKVLGPHASLMWHGGVTQPITAQQLGQVLDFTLENMDENERRALLDRRPRSDLLRQLDLARLELITRETEFFRAAGVDQRISTLGHLYERQLLQGELDYMGWDFSLDDLATLGIRQIRVKNDEQWNPVFPFRGRRIYRIRLDELHDFQPRIPPMQPSIHQPSRTDRQIDDRNDARKRAGVSMQLLDQSLA